jgi:hypothetical protein
VATGVHQYDVILIRDDRCEDEGSGEGERRGWKGDDGGQEVMKEGVRTACKRPSRDQRDRGTSCL